MKVFVFGGDGFVGKYLCLDLVKQGYEVVICDINHTSKHEVYDKCSYVNIDIR